MRLLASLTLPAAFAMPARGAVANSGVLLKLAEEGESFGVSGPYFPSSSFFSAGLRPRLVISYAVPTAGPSP